MGNPRRSPAASALHAGTVGHRGAAPPRFALGVDLGATKVVSGRVSRTGELDFVSGRKIHSNGGPRRVLEELLESVQDGLALLDRPPECIGLGIAAQVDPARGMAVHAPNLRWRNVPIGSRVARALSLPVAVVNDARAATYAEWRFGAGRGVDDLFVLSLGTGIGGSAVVGGRLIEGSTHAAGEVGHITVVGGGRPCTCPNRGCFEAHAGGWAIGKEARARAAANPRRGAALVRAAGRVEAIRADTVFRAARAGDRLAREIVAEAERALEDGVVSVVNSFNPARLVLVGGLVSGWPRLVTVARRAVRARCQPPAARAEVVRGELGERATLIGAATLALDGAGRNAA